MNKIKAIGFVLVIVLSFTTAALADEDNLKVKGTVTSISTATKSVTIQPKEGNAVTVIMEDGDLLAKVKEGEKGQATYTVKDGKNIGLKLKKMHGGCS